MCSVELHDGLGRACGPAAAAAAIEQVSRKAPAGHEPAAPLDQVSSACRARARARVNEPESSNGNSSGDSGAGRAEQTNKQI